MSRKFAWYCVLLVAFSVAACSWAVFTKPQTTARDIDLKSASVKDFTFLEGMAGPEGIWADPASMKIFVTDCSGKIYALDGADRKSLKIVNSQQIAKASALGLTVGPDNLLYVGIADKSWSEEGGYVARVSQTFSDKEVLTGVFQGLNGMDFSPEGDLYFATSNMSYKHADGRIMKLPGAQKGATPVKVAEDLGVANGLKFNPTNGMLYFTDVFSGLYSLDLKKQTRQTVLGKAEKFEFIDDICFDKDGRPWATAAAGFIKTPDPKTGTSIRFHMEGIGSTSACAIRTENGEEMIYITEFKKPGNSPKSKVYDGRGIVSFPLSVLRSYL